MWTLTFVIVGAGAAGGVMAAWLSEDRAKHVLLIEAGTDYQRAGNNQGLPDAIRYGYGNPGNGGPAEVRGHHWYPDSDNPLAAPPPSPCLPVSTATRARPTNCTRSTFHAGASSAEPLR